LKFEESGVSYIRAKMVNKNSGEVSYTDTLKVIAYDLPEATLDVPRSIFVNQPATAKFIVNDGQEEVVTQFSIDRGKTWLTQDELNIERSERSTISMRARIRYAYAPEDDRRAWKTFINSISIVDPKPPIPYLRGPRMVESGVEYDYSFDLRPPFPGLSDKAQGEIHLPDGTVIDVGEGESTFKYTARAEDVKNGFINMIVKSWVKGFKETTFSERTTRFRSWTYVWPEFTVSGKTNYNEVPSEGRIIIAPSSNLLRYMEGLNYEWILPEGTEVTYSTDSYKRIKFNNPGVNTVQIKMTDDRGNESVLDYEVSLENTPMTTAELLPRSSIDGMNEPAKGLFLLRYKYGHRLDRLKDITWSLNGQELTDQAGRGIIYISDLAAGEYNLETKLETKLGQEINSSYNFSVKENELPTCTATTSVYNASQYTAQVRCTDTDGFVTGYEWYDDNNNPGVVMSRGTRVSGSLVNGQVPDFRISITDNSKGTIDFMLKDID
jgi:hypothetical protein